MIEITGKLIAVLVPDDAFEFKTEYEDKYTSLLVKRKSVPDNNPFSDENTYEDWHYFACILETSRKSPIPEINIIGTITQSGQFDFDCEKYAWKNPKSGKYHKWGEPYMNDWGVGKFETPEESFLSLLNSKGIFLDQLQNQKVLILEKA